MGCYFQIFYCQYFCNSKQLLTFVADNFITSYTYKIIKQFLRKRNALPVKKNN